jgi:hypothetical protein
MLNKKTIILVSILDPRLATHHSNIDVRSRNANHLGSLTLGATRLIGVSLE